MGVHADVGQANLQVRGVDGVVTDLGPNFPALQAAAWYRLEMYSPPEGDFVGWKLTNLLTGDAVFGEFTDGQLPAAGQFLAAKLALITSAASAQAMLAGHFYLETDL